MTPPDCRIYIDTDLSDNELLTIVRTVVFPPADPARGQAELFKNEDYHQERRRAFPGGFVFFRFYLDLALQGTVEQRSSRVGALLDELWAQGIAAVAGCSYEHLLPEHGGFRSENTPWVSD